MDTSKFKDDIVFWDTLREKKFCFHSTWGLFSPSVIDEGSRLLINAMEIHPSDMVLDLGCGYGPIGIVAASLAPQGHVHMVDKDFVAVEFAKNNAALNYLKNCECYLSNGFSHIDPKRTFHVILSNPPSHMPKELLTTFFQDAKSHLKPGGKFYLVIAVRLKNYLKEALTEIFGNYEKLAVSKDYIVASATKM